MSIHVVLRFDPVGKDGVGVLAETLPFTPGEETDNVGAMWVGVCLAVNEYVRSQGIDGFDCMKQYPDGVEATAKPKVGQE